MGESNRLGPLQMSVSGHQCLVMLLRHSQDYFFKLQQQFSYFHDLPLHIHMHIQRHLVVAAPGRMQSCPRVPDPFRQSRFHVHMDIFQRYAEFKVAGFNVLQNILQPRHDFRSVCLRNNAAFYQHLGMGNTAPDILLIQTLIIINGRIECVH